MPVVVANSFSDSSTQSSSSGGGGSGGGGDHGGAGERVVPDFKVKIDGTPIRTGLVAALNWVEIQQSIRLVDMAVINFSNYAGKLSDAPEFKKGKEIEIEVGYVGEVAWAFKGEIISIEPQFPIVGNPSVSIRAYDKLHRYRRGRHQKTFLNQKVSEVVQALAGAEGLSADVEDTKLKHEYLLQNNQSNIEFIHELARRHGYEVDVDAKAGKLSFKKGRYDKPKAIGLKWGESLKSFHVRKSVANVHTEVKARYWNMKDKKHVLEKSKELHGSLETLDEAPAESKKAFKDGIMQISLRPNTAPAEAKALAWSIFNEQALNAVQGRGTCLGEPAIKPGVVIELLGLGKTWSGLYYVWAATHLLRRTSGYSTQFDLRRPGTGYSVEPDTVTPPPTVSREPADTSSMGATVEREETAPAKKEVKEEEDEDETTNVKLKFVDEDGEPFVNKPFDLKLGSDTISGTTGPDGKIVADVPKDAEDGEVSIWLEDDKSDDPYNWKINLKDA